VENRRPARGHARADLSILAALTTNERLAAMGARGCRRIAVVGGIRVTVARKIRSVIFAAILHFLMYGRRLARSAMPRISVWVASPSRQDGGTADDRRLLPGRCSDALARVFGSFGSTLRRLFPYADAGLAQIVWSIASVVTVTRGDNHFGSLARKWARAASFYWLSTAVAPAVAALRIIVSRHLVRFADARSCCE